VNAKLISYGVELGDAGLHKSRFVRHATLDRNYDVRRRSAELIDGFGREASGFNRKRNGL
jgi:hypothetical protein